MQKMSQSESLSTFSCPPVKKLKAEVRNARLNKEIAIRKAKTHGKEHVNHGNKSMRPRETGELCNCIHKCCSTVPVAIMKEMIGKMNNFATKNEQDIFLQGLIDIGPLQNCKKRMSDADLKTKSKSKTHKWKSNSFKYHIEFNNRQTVCRVAFQSLFGITKKRVERLCNLKRNKQVPKDMRGKSPGSRSRMIPAEDCHKILTFINSIPVMQRVQNSNTIRSFLPAGLNVKIIYEKFLETHPECENIIKYKFFLKYCHEKFNLEFGHTRTQIDVCSICEELNNKTKNSFLNEDDKQFFVEEQMMHKQRANKFFKKVDLITSICQESQKVAALCLDYMQNLPLPRLPVQEVFYYHLLWLNELCIHNLKSEEATFYSYHEGEGRKGPDEVCSFLYDYIKKNVAKEVEELHLFCPGQNRNDTIIRFLQALVITRRFSAVSIYFSQGGHSFNECDRHFAKIKKKILLYDRLYSSQEYENLIESSSNKFKVKHVTHRDVASFKVWWPKFFKKKVLSSKSYGGAVLKKKKSYFAVDNYFEFNFFSDEPELVIAKPFIDSFEMDSFPLLKNKREDSMLFIPDPEHFPAYLEKIPINIKKIQDTRKLNRYIPDNYKDFYNEINEWPASETEETP